MIEAMIRVSRIFFLGALCVLFNACSSNNLPKYAVIQGLRVLSLVSDTPEINFDGATFNPTTVNITPVVSDLYGGGRALNYNLEWCLDLGIAVGAVPNCVGNPTRAILAADQAIVATATFLTPNFTGSLTPVAVDFSTATASALALISQKFTRSTLADQFNGLALIVVFEVYPVGSFAEKVSSFKRIIFSSGAKAAKNADPTGLEIRNSGTEIAALPAVDSSTMEAYLPANQTESYFQMNSDGSTTAKTEELETTWFLTGPADIGCSKKGDCTSDGLFLLTRTKPGEMNTFSAPIAATPNTRGRVLIAVARDNRGGVMVKRYCTGICP